MRRQEAALRPGVALPAVRGAGGWREKPVPVPGPAGRGAGAREPAGTRPHRRRDPAVVEERKSGAGREGRRRSDRPE